MNKNEDLSICKECGGYCCKKSGCDYWVDDLKDKSYKGILDLLSMKTTCSNLTETGCSFSYEERPSGGKT